MRVAFVAAALVLGLATHPASAADEPVRIELKVAKGKLWTVEQRVELASANKGTTVFAGGAGRAAMIVTRMEAGPRRGRLHPRSQGAGREHHDAGLHRNLEVGEDLDVGPS